MATSRQCETCGASIPGRADPRTRFCSNACRQKAYRRRSAGAIPLELRQRERWVRYTPKKVPLTTAGRPASSTDPSTWSSYASVRSRSRRGFVLNGDGITCIDLDHCLIDGQVTGRAARILEALPNTYVEVSLSGKGLHIFGWAPPIPGRRLPDGVEVYGSGRYIAVTGKPFGASRCLGDISAVVNSLL